MTATRKWTCTLAAGTILWMVCAGVALAQVKTTTTERKGQASKQVAVERGEVVYASGNAVVIKMESGEVREITVPAGATAIVDGKTITVADLRPGMKLQKTIATTTTPKVVETVKTGTGTVLNVQAPNYVTVRFEDNTVERYRIPAGTKFTIDGQEKTAFDLRSGQKITATRVTLQEATEVNKMAQVTGTMPPAEGALLIAAPAKSAKAETPATAEKAVPTGGATAPPAKTLPKTASPLPLIGLLGLLFSGASFGVRLLRRS